MEGTEDNERCCPECAWKRPDEEGGCAGGVKCNPDKICEEAKVELPGVQYRFDLDNVLSVDNSNGIGNTIVDVFSPRTTENNTKILVNTVCSSESSTEDCYHPNHEDAMKRQPYIKVITTDDNTLSSIIGNPVNTASGQNEYDCAVKCGSNPDGSSNDIYTGTIETTTGDTQRLITVKATQSFTFDDITNGDFVTITGVVNDTGGQPGANGRWLVDSVNTVYKTFRLMNSSSKGNYVSGGSFTRESRYSTTDSQVDCSKRCLPKLWRWYPIFESKNGVGLRYTGGYYQSDELMRYLPSDIMLRTCKSESCETNRSTTAFDEYHNCTECKTCMYEFQDSLNTNEFSDAKYDCGSCSQCLLTQPSALGDMYQVVCKNMTNCNTCKNNTQSTIFENVNYNECLTCTTPDPNDPNSGCKVYTLDPYVTVGNKTDFHKGSSIYNHGADPSLSYVDTNSYNPDTVNASTDALCSPFGPISPKTSCANTLNGKIGWDDGLYYSIPEIPDYNNKSIKNVGEGTYLTPTGTTQWDESQGTDGFDIFQNNVSKNLINSDVSTEAKYNWDNYKLIYRAPTDTCIYSNSDDVGFGDCNRSDSPHAFIKTDTDQYMIKNTFGKCLQIDKTGSSWIPQYSITTNTCSDTNENQKWRLTQQLVPKYCQTKKYGNICARPGGQKRLFNIVGFKNATAGNDYPGNRWVWWDDGSQIMSIAPHSDRRIDPHQPGL
jgi:hypothetical protein